MGCGESKQAVATANTISQTKRSNSKKTDGSENKTSIENVTDDVKTNSNSSLEEQEKAAKLIAVPENGNANDKEGENATKDAEVVNEKESENPKSDNVKGSDHQGNGESVGETVKENEVKEAAVVADDAKEASEEKDLKVKSIEKSSKKDEETIESVISEGITEKSDNTPPGGAKTGPSEDKTEVNEAVEEKGSTTETKIEDALNENEGNQIKEGKEAVQTAEIVVNTGEEKAPAAKEENATESLAKGPQTN